MGPFLHGPATIDRGAAAAGVDVARLGALARATRPRRLARRARVAPRARPRGPRSRCCRWSLAAPARAARRRPERPALAVLVEDDEAARELAEAVAAFLPGAPVGYLPSRGVAWGSGARPAAAPRRRARPGARRCSPAAASWRCRPRPWPSGPAPRDRARSRSRVARGDELERDDLIAALVAAGYERVDGTVDERGQVVGARRHRRRVPVDRPGAAARSSSSATRSSASRVFSLLTQRSLRDLDECGVYPAARRPPTPARPGCTTTRTARRTCPTGLVPLAPELSPRARVVAWEPAPGRGGDRASASARSRLPSRLRGRPTCARRTRSTLVERAHALDSTAAGPAGHVRGPARRRSPARGVAEAENELRAAWCGAGCGCWSPSRIAARPSGRAAAAARRRGGARRRRRAAEPAPGVLLRRLARCAAAVVAPPLGRRGAAVGAGLPPPSPPPTRRVGRAIALVHRPAARRLRRARGPRRRRASPGSTPRPSPASPATTWSWSSSGEDKLFVPARAARQGHALRRRRRARARALQARRQGVARRSRPARGTPCTSWPASCSRCTPRGRPCRGSAYRDDDELMRAARGGFPYSETDDQARAIEAVKDDLESHAADGPADLRRRRLRQDRGRDAGGVEGRRGRAARCWCWCRPRSSPSSTWQTFRDRFRDFPVRVELVSRFRKRRRGQGRARRLRARARSTS